MFVHLPGAADCVDHIVKSIEERGAKISDFFHKNVTHLITSNDFVEIIGKGK